MAEDVAQFLIAMTARHGGNIGIVGARTANAFATQTIAKSAVLLGAQNANYLFAPPLLAHFMNSSRDI